MINYVLIGLGCAAIPSILFYILAPEELKRYTACLYISLTIVTIALVMFVVSGTGGPYKNG